MSESRVTLTNAQLVDLARLQGLALDEARAERLRPKIESLLTRLAALGKSLPREAEPPPSPPPGGAT